MTEKIQTRIFQYGDEKESSWPPRFGTGGSGVYHLGKDGKIKKGCPAPEVIPFGKAPYVIQDTIEPYRHPATGRWLESRSALRQEDAATGTITTDKKLAPIPHRQRQLERERRQDGHDALHKAVAQIDAGTAPLTEETKALCEQQNEIIASATGWDTFNVAGKKDNPRGKKYRGRKR